MIESLAARRRAVSAEAGFTLLELLVVLFILAILLTITVVSLTGYRERAAKVSASANVRSALPAITAYRADHGTFEGMTVAGLKADYDTGLSSTLLLSDLTADGFCVQQTLSGKTAHFAGPGGKVEEGPC